ncbi:MAG: hypothetical protein K0V04_39120 [Deltaproteobacteria bacterium]|nr:hypothetical protein [Deltaproteobacteria bacterium]
MTRKLPPDGALVNLTSHWEESFVSGRLLSTKFSPPVLFDLDAEDGRVMPTFFVSPALLVRRSFAEALRNAGVDNIDTYEAIIRDPENEVTITDYQVLNIVGLVSCADMEESKVESLGEGINVIDTVVIDSTRVADVSLFRLAEDPINIVISDELHDQIVRMGYDDIYFEQLALT